MREAEYIRSVWMEIERDNPDASTEWLMAMVADRILSETGQQIDAGDIAAALEEDHERP